MDELGVFEIDLNLEQVTESRTGTVVCSLKVTQPA